MEHLKMSHERQADTEKYEIRFFSVRGNIIFETGVNIHKSHACCDKKKPTLRRIEQFYHSQKWKCLFTP